MNEDGTPFKNVLDKNFDTANVVKMPSKITRDKINDDRNEEPNPTAPPTKKRLIMQISVGNLPLQGTKLLVIIAIKRSLGESIILHPITPQALHPKPMHMLSTF